jgi:elongator complex protein 3
MFEFNPEKYQNQIKSILQDLKGIPDNKLNGDTLRSTLKKYPKDGKELFSKNQLLSGYKLLLNENLIKSSEKLETFLTTKPTRTVSGVAPVTVLTKPYPCPGNCIYCPDVSNMPKSYIPSEPGAQRAALNNFDPYTQTYNRLLALNRIGHSTDKIELIIIGGTWSAYKRDYQIWFVKECFRALNTFTPAREFYKRNYPVKEKTEWKELIKQHKKNETAKSRCVGLSIETRPDCITEKEVLKMRKLGATKVQIGIQSLDHDVLTANKRGHNIAEIQKAFRLLRTAGFKIQAHWMPNLYKSNPETDLTGYRELWTSHYHPDEIKIYPTSVIKDTELYNLYQSGRYAPYTQKQLEELLEKFMLATPRYCRITRVIRDIPEQEIEAGSKTTNLRQVVHQNMSDKGVKCECIRCREIRDSEFHREDLEPELLKFTTSIGTDYFLSYKTKSDKIAAFLRLTIPKKKNRKTNFIEDLLESSIIREIHVYGVSTAIGDKDTETPQHEGLGKKLINWSQEITKNHGINNIAVISAVGTRRYYAKRGFKRSSLYMTKELNSN